MKNILKIIIALLIFIIGILMIMPVVKDKDDKKDENVKVKEVELSFLVDTFVGQYEQVELTEEEEKEIISKLNNLDYTKVDVKLAFFGDYKIMFDDKELIFDDNNDSYGRIKENGEEYTINIKEVKELILSYIKNKDISRIYLYHRYDISTTNFYKIDLEEADKELIKQNFKYRELEEFEIVNLMIAGSYVVIVDDKSLAFDDLNGYAMYEDEMVFMDGELAKILKKYVNNEECCSCCPNLEEDEVCITMCCPCN